MNLDEATAILAILKTAYPNSYKGMDSEDIDDAISLWATMFETDNVKIVTEAVKSFIATDTKGFPPVIGQINAKIALITQPETMSEMEAWQQVCKAISIYNATENFAKLSPTLQKIIGSPNQLREWAVMDSETVNSVIQSNFMRSYKAVVAREKEISLLPESTKQMIAGVAERMAITDGRD